MLRTFGAPGDQPFGILKGGFAGFQTRYPSQRLTDQWIQAI